MLMFRSGETIYGAGNSHSISVKSSFLPTFGPSSRPTFIFSLRFAKSPCRCILTMTLLTGSLFHHSVTYISASICRSIESRYRNNTSASCKICFVTFSPTKRSCKRGWLRKTKSRWITKTSSKRHTIKICYKTNYFTILIRCCAYFWNWMSLTF